MIKERRKYIRIDTVVPFDYKLKGSQEEEKKGVTKNVSPGGIRALLDAKIKKGDWLELKIYLPDLDESIVTTAKVIWTGEEKEGRIDCGITFEEIAPLMKNKFLEYICDLMVAELEKTTRAIT